MLSKYTLQHEKTCEIANSSSESERKTSELTVCISNPVCFSDQNSDCIYFIQIVEKSGANIKSLSEFVIFLCVLMNKFLELDMTLYHGLRTPNEAFFHWNPELLGLGRQIGQTNWADKFWGIWGIFGRTINTNFGTVRTNRNPYY